MDPNKSCIFFAGGKRFNIDSTNNKSSFQISKNQAGEVVIDVKFTISALEAKDVIRNYSELPQPQPGIVEIQANTVYVEAYDQQMKAKDILIEPGTFTITFEKDVYSEIILKGIIIDSGKTDHAKTDHII